MLFEKAFESFLCSGLTLSACDSAPSGQDELSGSGLDLANPGGAGGCLRQRNVLATIMRGSGSCEGHRLGVWLSTQTPPPAILPRAANSQQAPGAGNQTNTGIHLHFRLELSGE